jgi:hypothetical protein
VGTAVATNSSMPHNYYKHLKALLGPACLAFFVIFAPATHAANLNFAWDPSNDPNVAGYKLSYGTASGTYSKSLNAGNSNSASVTSLTPGATYYFVVTAYNSIGLQSLPSNEVSITMPANVPPTVSLTSPQANSTINGQSPIGLTATASDSDGSVVKVEFYQGTNKIGEATSAPYAATWNNAPSGNFTLSALAYDDSGAAVRSAGVPITVSGIGPTASPTPTPAAAATKIRVIAMTPIIRAGAIATFKITASEVNTVQPTVVNYALGGTATAGVDYSMSAVPTQITIPTGGRSAIFSLTTMSSANGSNRKTAILTVMPGTGYTPGRASAVVKIVGH